MADSSGGTAREQWLGRRRRQRHWEKRVKSVVCVWVCWGLGVGMRVALCCLGLGVCVCVYVPSHLKHSRQGSLCLSWNRGQSVCGCVLCGCVCVCSISAQAFQTGVFMFELRTWTVCVWLCSVWVCACMFHLSSNIPDRGLYVWAEIGDSLCVAVFCVGVKGLWLCPNPSHSVPALYPYFQAHAFNSPFKRALVLFLFYSYPFSYYFYPFPYYYYPLSSSLHSSLLLILNLLSSYPLPMDVRLHQHQCSKI